MMEFDPLNSPSRVQHTPVTLDDLYTLSFNSTPLAAPTTTIDSSTPPLPEVIISDSPLIDFTAKSPLIASRRSSFHPKPLSLCPPSSSSQPQLVRPSPLKFSISQDDDDRDHVEIYQDDTSFFHNLPPSVPLPDSPPRRFNDAHHDESGLISFVQDSPPPRQFSKIVSTLKKGQAKGSSSSFAPLGRIDENGINASRSSEADSTGSMNHHEEDEKKPVYSRGRVGKKWGVMRKVQRDENQSKTPKSCSIVGVLNKIDNSMMLSPLQEGDSIAHFDPSHEVSLIVNEGGSFLCQQDDEQPDGDYDDEEAMEREIEERKQRLGLRLSKIGEEEEERPREEVEEVHRDEAKEQSRRDVSEISVGMSTLFEDQHRLLDDKTRLVDQTSGGGTTMIFDGSMIGTTQLQDTTNPFSFTSFSQSTLPRQFQLPRQSDHGLPQLASISEFENDVPSMKKKKETTSSILPPELVSPVKRTAFPPPPTPLSTRNSRKTTTPFDKGSLAPPKASSSTTSKPTRQTPRYSASTVNPPSQIRSRTSNKGKVPRSTSRASSNGSSPDTSSTLSNQGSQEISRDESSFGAGDSTTFGWWDRIGKNGGGKGEKTSEMSTALIDQLPPTEVLRGETTRTIELCLQTPLVPTRRGSTSSSRSSSFSSIKSNRSDLGEGEEEGEDLASSTRTVRAATSSKRVEEVDLIGMEEPSMFVAGDETKADIGSSVASSMGSNGGKVETGADRLKRRMEELRLQKLRSNQIIPSTPSVTSSRPYSLLDQTPAVNQNRPFSLLDQTPLQGPFPTSRSTTTTIRRLTSTQSRAEPAIGNLISVEQTPRPASLTRTLSFPRTKPRMSVQPTPSTPSNAVPVTVSSTLTDGSKTPGERKETTRARLERMREERKAREGGAGGKTPEPQTKGGIVRKSASARGLDEAMEGRTRTRSLSSSSSVANPIKRGASLADLRAKLVTKPSTTSATSSFTQPSRLTASTSTQSIHSTSTRKPAVSTSRRASLIPPPSSTSTSSLSTQSSRIRRPSLAPSTSSSSLAGSTDTRQALRR